MKPVFIIPVTWICVDLIVHAINREAGKKRHQKESKRSAEERKSKAASLRKAKARYSDPNDSHPLEGQDVIIVE